MNNVNITNADELQWTASETSRCFAAIASLWALNQALDAKGEEEQGLQSLQGYLVRQKEVADCLTDLWYENTCAMQRKAIRKANKVREPKLSCGTALTYWKGQAENELSAVREDSIRFRGNYCIRTMPQGCDNTLQIQAMSSAVNAAVMDVEHTRRMAERTRKIRWEAINGIVRSMSVNTGPIFQYMANAQALQTGLVNQAGSMMQGNLTAFGSLFGYATSGGS